MSDITKSLVIWWLKSPLGITLVQHDCPKTNSHIQSYGRSHFFLYIPCSDSIYLLNYYHQNPSSQHNHLDKLLIATILFHITQSTHLMTIQKSELTFKSKAMLKLINLPNMVLQSPLSNTSLPSHRASTPCWLASHHTSTQQHDGSIRTLS